VTEVCRRLETESFGITYLPVNRYGVVSAADVQAAIRAQLTASSTHDAGCWTLSKGARSGCERSSDSVDSRASFQRLSEPRMPASLALLEPGQEGFLCFILARLNSRSAPIKLNHYRILAQSQKVKTDTLALPSLRGVPESFLGDIRGRRVGEFPCRGEHNQVITPLRTA
jgi:hypothetical protein